MQFGGGPSSHQGGSSNWQRRRLNSEDLPSVRRLGKGLSGFLYETLWEGKKYVRKDFPLGSVHHNVFENEAIALVYLEHPNIIMCSHYTVGKSSCSLLLEYVDDDLQNFMQKRIEAQGKGNRIDSSTTLHSRVLNIDETRSLMSSKAKGRETTGADVGFMKMPENEPTVLFEVPEAVDIILQIATGIEYLHGNKIVHGDLKPKNVLVGYGGIVKLVDFGLLETKKRIKLVSKHTRHFEILMWKAPERFAELLGPVTEDSDDPFTDSDTDSDEEFESSVIFTMSAMADVYSFGLICSQILGGKLMYSNLSLTQLREQRMHGFRPELPSSCPDGLRILIFSTMERDPWRRPTFADICTALKAFQSNRRLLEVEGKKARSMSMDVLPDDPFRRFLSKSSNPGFEHSQHGFEHSQLGVEHPEHGVEEHMAASFGNVLLKTPTASPHPHPWDDFLDPVDPVSVQHQHDPPVSEYFSEELNSSLQYLENEDTTGSHATQQTTQWYGGMAVMPGEAGVTGDESRDNLVDTASTSTMLPYIHPPVAEEKPPFLRPFYSIYEALRGIARGEEVAFGSARRGRGIRVLATAFRFALRLRTKTVMREKWKKAERKRIREPQRQHKLRLQCMKRIRTGVPTPPRPAASAQSTITTDRRYKGITLRNGKWNAEIRMSASKAKVWIGAFSSEKEAALALDAGYYHCTEEKRKTFNFPQFVNQLGESQYQTVLALCNAGKEQAAKELVKELAAAHAAAFGAP